MATTDIIELPKIPNLKYIIDINGRGWFCSGEISNDGDLSSCTSADDTLYDRSF